MPTDVEIPGVGTVEFPDGMTDEQILQAIRANSPSPAPTPARQYTGMELGTPGIPRAPLPVDLQSVAQLMANAPSFINPRTGQKSPMLPPGIEGGPLGFLDMPVTGTQRAVRGIEQMAAPVSAAAEEYGRTELQQPLVGQRATTPAMARQLAGGASEVIRGGLEAATPLMVGAGAAAPITAAKALALFTGAQAGTEYGLTQAGVSPEYAALSGDIAGLAAGAIPIGLKAFEARIERHNRVADSLLKQEQQRGRVQSTMEDVIARNPDMGAPIPVDVMGKPREVQLAGAPNGKLVYSVVDPATGKQMFSGTGRETVEWLRHHGTEPKAEVPQDPAAIVRQVDPAEYQKMQESVQEGQLTQDLIAQRRAQIEAQRAAAQPAEVAPVVEPAPVQSPASAVKFVAPKPEDEVQPDTQGALPPPGVAPLPKPVGESLEINPTLKSPVVRVPLKSLAVDPARFQYKMKAIGKGGTTDEFRETKQWNPDLAGVIAVWKDPADGKVYVVNGHHRYELADRLGVPDLDVRFIDAKDATEARMKGAIINIAESKGTSVDAAKVFRDGQLTPEELEAKGVSMRGAIANEGMDLARLTPVLFNRVVQGDMTPRRGAIIGAAKLSDAAQESVLKLIESRERGGRRMTEEGVRELARRAGKAVEKVETTMNLFGEEEVAQNLVAEEVELVGDIRRRLGAEKRLFGAVATDSAAKRLSAAGNKIDAGKNQEVSEQAAQVLSIFDKLLDTHSGINDAIRAGAEDISNGRSQAEVRDAVYERVRAEVSSILNPLREGRLPGVVEGRPSSGSSATRAGERSPRPEDAAADQGSVLASESPVGRQESFIPDDEAAASRQAQSSYDAKVQGELASAELASPSSAKFDSGSSSIEDSPIFGGDRQASLLEESAPSKGNPRRANQRGSIPVKTGGTPQKRAERYEFADKNAEIRMEAAAKPTPQPDFREKLAKANAEWRQYFRLYRHIERGKHPGLVFHLLQQEKAGGWAKNKAALEILQTVTEFKSDAERYRTFTTKLVLDDLVESLDKWIESGEIAAVDAPDWEMPFGFTGTTLRNEHAKVSDFVKNDPAITAALARRKAMWTGIRDRYVKAMEDAGINMDGKLTREDYFRHRVVEYMQASDARSEGGNALQAPGRRSHLKRRKAQASAMDISTNYAEAEFQVLSQILKDTKTAELIGWIKNQSGMDLLPGLKKQAKKDLGTSKKWESLVPATHEVWYAEPGNYFYTAFTIPERIAKEMFENIGESVGLTSEDLRKVIALGGKKHAMVLPKEVVATLTEFGQQVQKTGFIGIADKWWTRGLSAWKRWVLVAPHRIVKYNLRNVTGDAEILFIGNQKAFKKAAQSAKDLSAYFTPIIKGTPEKAVMSPELESWFDRGGFQSMIQAQELGDMHNFDIVGQLERIQKTTINPWRWYWDKAQAATNFREAHLRYAAYLDYLEQMKRNKDGLPDNFGASRVDAITALDDPHDRAYVLANQLLGAYDEVSIVGRTIRMKLLPFFSYQETNLRRFYNLARNAWKNDEIAEKVGRAASGGGKGKAKAAAISAAYIGRMILKATALWGALYAVNRLAFPDEWDDLPPEVKRVPTIVLGRNADGTVRYFNRLGNLPDLLEWLDPIDGFLLVKDWMDDRISFPKMVGMIGLGGPVEKVVQSTTPEIKIPVEMVTGLTVYPNVTNPRPIRDRLEYLADQFGLGAGDVYRKLADKPISAQKRNPWNPVISSIWYESDPQSTAYYEFAKVKGKWLLEQGKGSGGGFLAMGQTARSEALYYTKQALRKEDMRAFSVWFKQYVALGGRPSNQTWASFDPLAGISKKDRKRFVDSLNEDQANMLRMANEYYADVMKRKNEYVERVRNEKIPTGKGPAGVNSVRREAAK